MNTVKRWLAGVMTVALVLTSSGLSSIGAITAYAASNDIVVTNTDGTKYYDTSNYASAKEAFDKALTETVSDYAKDTADPNKKNQLKTPVITLNVDIAASVEKNTISIPLVIDLNGHTLKDYTNLQAGTDYCVNYQNSEGTPNPAWDEKTIVFAEHDPTYVANWKYDASAEKGLRWVVVSVDEKCNNCGTIPHTVELSETIYDASTGIYTYKYNDKEIFTKDEAAETAGNYTLAEDHPYIVCVNDHVQHESDGKPQVKASITENASGAAATATIVVAEATAEELNAKPDVFEADGITKVVDAKNEAATCTKCGTKIYKAVVSDPDGRVLKTKYLKDHEAIPMLAHEKGALKSYELLTKSKDGYDTEAEAKAVKGFVKSTVENGQYYAWTWVPTIIDDAKTVTKEAKVKTITLTDAVEADGSFTYRLGYECDYYGSSVNKDDHTNTVLYDDPVTVKPYANATTAAEAKDGKHSLCTDWAYPSFSKTYEFTRQDVHTVKNKDTMTFTVSNAKKTDESTYSHVDDGTKYVYDETENQCSSKDGKNVATIHCAICDHDATVPLPHTWGVFSGTTPKASKIDSDFTDEREVTLSTEDGATIATIAATCTLPGATYKYCTGQQYNHKVAHWAKQSTIPAKGHDFAPVAVENVTWSTNLKKTSDLLSSDDVACTAKQRCRVCDTATNITYHSTKGNNDASNVYDAVKVNDPKVGVDCQHDAVRTVIVNGLTYSTGKAVEETFIKDVANGFTNGTKGPHKLSATNFNWSNNLEKATVTGKCTVSGCKEASLTADATVTKSTATSGLTTFTATYGDNTETKETYTFTGATVAFDTAAISDANLFKGIKDYAAPKAPAVTLTINGTVIDTSAYSTEWTVEEDRAAGNADSAREVYVTAKWPASVKNYVGNNYKDSNTYNYAALKDDLKQTTKVYRNNEAVADVNLTPQYNKDTTYSVVTTPSIKTATVKYAITNEKVTVKDRKDWVALQKKVEALNFNLDKVESIKNTGSYFVYAQISAPGYTTYTDPDPVATLVIGKMKVTLLMDNETVVEGDAPKLNMRAVDDYGNTVDIDLSEFVVKTAGGQDLDNLAPGTYKLVATAPNYQDKWDISYNLGNDYLAILTVVAKDGTTAEDQAKAAAVEKKIEALTDSSSATEVAAARKEYDALSDAAKGRVDAATVKKLTDAEDKVAADKVVAQLNGASTDADKAAAYEAYSKLSDAQKKLVDAKAAEAVAAAKAAAEAAADKAAAQKVADQLNKLTTSSSEADVTAARKAYDALTAAQKALVSADTVKKLTEAEKAVEAQKAAAKKVVKGKSYKVSKNTYKVTKVATAKANGTVTFTKAKNAKTVTVPATVKLKDGKSYKVTVVGAKAFTAKKIRTVTIGKNVKQLKKNAFAKSKATKINVKTKLLTKSKVKGSLKSSKVKTVTVKVGKAYVKKYKKIFTKANAGKKVTVK